MNIIRQWLFRRRRQIRKEEEEPSLEVRKMNPYLSQLRFILEQVLKARGLEYRNLRLIIIDTDMEPESLLDEDDVGSVLEQLSYDLNFLTVLTNRPAYFQKFVETMYEENGLPVNLYSKGEQRKTDANTVLDFEQQGSLWNLNLTEPSIYLPIYKKQWETAENLDISVPIGYNTVIVKGIRVVKN